jgi:GNAT superfamily N-acetyltransferase
VGWCPVAPREEFPVLQRSRTLKPVDDTPVWSVVYFFVDKAYRNTGMSAHLLRAAVQYVMEQGGHIVEGYPIEPRTDQMPGIYSFTGLVSTFESVGFVECLRRSPSRPIMRMCLDND